MPNYIKYFLPEGYPKKELLKPFLDREGLDYSILPANYCGKSEAFFLPQLLVELYVSGKTNIFSNNEIELDSKLGKAKTDFVFYTTWAGFTKEQSSAVFRYLRQIGKNVILSTEEKYYYVLLSKIIFDTRNGIFSPIPLTFGMILNTWQTVTNTNTIMPINILENCINVANHVFIEQSYYIVKNSSVLPSAKTELENLTHLACQYDFSLLLPFLENNISGTKIKRILELGIPFEEALEYTKNTPDNWLEIINTET